MKEIKVDMADLKIDSSPTLLIASAIGSCIAVCVYDSRKRVGGLAHVMLPHSEHRTVFRPYRFANLVLPDLVRALEKLGATRETMGAKIVGGANLFPFLLKKEEEQMGYRNTISVREILKDMGIRLLGEHVGGNFGRSVRFSLETGIVTVEVKI